MARRKQLGHSPRACAYVEGVSLWGEGEVLERGENLEAARRKLPNPDGLKANTGERVGAD